MKAITEEKNGIRLSVTEVTRNKEYNCSGCPSYVSERCAMKQRLMISDNKSNLICTEIVVVMANLSNRAVQINPRQWELVDSEGFTFGCQSFCEKHLSARMIDPANWEITPGTQVKFALAFPEMEEKVNAISLIYNGNTRMRINVRKPTKKVEELLQAKELYSQTQAKIRTSLGNN